MYFGERRADRAGREPDHAISQELELSVFDWRAHVKTEKVSEEVGEIMDRIVAAFAAAPSEETDAQMEKKIGYLESIETDGSEISSEKNRSEIKNWVSAMIWWAEDKRIIKPKERHMLQPAMFEILK